MKTLTAVLAIGIILVAGMVQAASTVTLAWDQVGDAKGYRVYQSSTSGTYNKATGKVCDTSATVLTCTLSNIPDGKYYWVATAYDSAGNESDLSNEVSMLFDTTKPNPPSNFKITLITVAQ